MPVIYVSMYLHICTHRYVCTHMHKKFTAFCIQWIQQCSGVGYVLFVPSTWSYMCRHIAHLRGSHLWLSPIEGGFHLPIIWERALWSPSLSILGPTEPTSLVNPMHLGDTNHQQQFIASPSNHMLTNSSWQIWVSSLCARHQAVLFHSFFLYMTLLDSWGYRL